MGQTFLASDRFEEEKVLQTCPSIRFLLYLLDVDKEILRKKTSKGTRNLCYLNLLAGQYFLIQLSIRRPSHQTYEWRFPAASPLSLCGPFCRAVSPKQLGIWMISLMPFDLRLEVPSRRVSGRYERWGTKSDWRTKGKETSTVFLSWFEFQCCMEEIRNKKQEETQIKIRLLFLSLLKLFSSQINTDIKEMTLRFLRRVSR